MPSSRIGNLARRCASLFPVGVPWADPHVRANMLATARRYASALAIAALSILLRLWLEPLLGPSGFAIALVGMLLAAWVGGLGPSLICQTLILLATAVWFNSDKPSPSPMSLRGIVSLIAFYGVGSIVALLSEAWQAARKRAADEARSAVSQREQLRTTLACIADGVLVADAAGRITLLNPVAETMTGWSQEESQGKPFRDICAICDERAPDKFLNPVDRVLRENQVLHESMQLILTTRNQSRLPVAYSAAPIHDGAGRPTGVVLVVHDETERRRTELALREADRRKDEFLATLAHELRNPLAPICMGVELMKLSADDPAASHEVRDMMERQLKQMVRLIDDLLDVSRVTRGKLELKRARVLLREVVRNAIEATRPQIDEARHSLEVELPASPVSLFADLNRLTQVVSNLLHNAAKFTPAGGNIRLSAAETDGVLSLVVADSGCGIPFDKREEIFNMFTQLGSSNGSSQGLGIGLTLVKQLVEMHGGVIDVHSDGPGQGSRFQLRLPVMAAWTGAVPAAAGGDSSQPRPAGQRILVVDDNEDALRTLAVLVQRLGNEVFQAHDGQQALEAAARHRPDVVLMDLGMPRMDGWEAARRIRREPWGEEICIIATTGWGQEDQRQRTKEAGFDHHLVKPVDVERLRELLSASAGPRVAEIDARSAPNQRTSEGAASAGAARPSTNGAARQAARAALVAQSIPVRPSTNLIG